jgi:uncharacterized metal-binding protein YceD (DUF177 family)
MAIERIRVKDMINTGQKEVRLDEQYDYADLLPTKEPVHVDALAHLTATGLAINGNFEAHLEEPCDRCSSPYERWINSRFEEQYVHAALVDEVPGGDMQLHNEDFYDVLGPDGTLDVKDLVYQHIIIAMSNDRVCNQETCTL